jgi:hypothetical protein
MSTTVEAEEEQVVTAKIKCSVCEGEFDDDAVIRSKGFQFCTACKAYGEFVADYKKIMALPLIDRPSARSVVMKLRKLIAIGLLVCGMLNAQTALPAKASAVQMQEQAYGIVAGVMPQMGAVFGPVSVVLSGSGTTVIRDATGYTPKNASLVTLDICDDGAEKTVLPATRVRQEVISQLKTHMYSSEEVDAVLNWLAQKDHFARAQKIIVSGGNVITLLTALFKTASPELVAGLIIAPQVAAAILPAVGSPRDVLILQQKLMKDDAVWSLAPKGSGNDCHTAIAVMMTANVPQGMVLVIH